MTELVEYLVKELVDSPDEVKVSEDGEVINVSVAKSDMGKIIGKQGRIVKSIRAIVKSVATKQGKKCTVEILEAE
jgi:hypothetical protein